MIWLDFISKLVKSLAWPATLIFIVLLFRKPLINLFRFAESLQWKDWKLNFQRQTKELEASNIDQMTAKGKVELEKYALLSPRQAVLKAWSDVEVAAESKLKTLLPAYNQIELGANGALGYLDFKGAFVPRTKKTLYDLGALRNQAVHLPETAISSEDASSYIRTTQVVIGQINSLTSIPAIKLNRLTYLIFEYNHLLDSGKFDHLTLEDIRREILSGTILRYLAKEAAGNIDLSLILDSNYEMEFEREYIRHLQSICGGYAGRERKKWGVESRGLCLLIAWTAEIIQTGSGWYPKEEVD